MKLIEQFENEWVFEDPTITLAIDDEFAEALEASRLGDLRAAERIARAVVGKCPNHIDTLHHLAIHRRPANCGSRSSSTANQYFERNSEPVVQASNHLQ